MAEVPQQTFVMPELYFEWQEYIVFALILVASMSIGVFYGFFATKNKTNEEFLMAGRSMGVFPVAMSLICTCLSAVGLLGFPVETYLYGTQFALQPLGIVILTLILAYIYVPVFVEINLISVMQYFELRFSRRVRVLCSLSSIIYLIFYVPVTVFAPSLALDQVAGINVYISCAAILFVCIGYTSIGGLKAVLWTDVLQGIVMMVSLLAIIIVGTIEAGGVSQIVDRNEKSNRIEFFNFDLDPRTRQTVWSTTLGSVAFWLPVFAATQAQVQRYNSLPNLKAARKALIFNMIGLIAILLFSVWIGMTIYAMYYDCDPISADIVDSPDQLLPLFVMDVLAKYPGLPGLLAGGLTCGTLSTVSSALNGLAATITEDFIKHYRPNITDQKLTRLSKIISASAGLISFCLVFPIAYLNEFVQVLPLVTLLGGLLLAPTFGAITLGMFFPWANEIGIFFGFLASAIVCGYQGLGQILASSVPGKLPDQRLCLTTAGCEVVDGASSIPLENECTADFVNPWKERQDPLDVQIWSISFSWLPGIAIGTTIVFGLIFSAIANAVTNGKKKQSEERLFAYPLLKLWKLTFGQKHLETWVAFSQEKNEQKMTQSL